MHIIISIKSKSKLDSFSRFSHTKKNINLVEDDSKSLVISVIYYLSYLWLNLMHLIIRKKRIIKLRKKI